MQMSAAHHHRESSIRRCITVFSDEMNKLRADGQQTDDQARQLRRAQQTVSHFIALITSVQSRESCRLSDDEIALFLNFAVTRAAK